MATCYNKNTPQYKALENKFKSSLKIDGYIDAYQRTSKSDEIPSVANIETMLKRRQTMLSIKKRSYKKSILANLSRMKLINNHNGQYKVNHSNPITRTYSPTILNRNYQTILKVLQHNRIPIEAVTFKNISNSVAPTDPTYFTSFVVDINANLLKNLDELKDTVDTNKTNVISIINQLKSTFPNVQVDIVSNKEAEEYYNLLPTAKKAKVPFNKINAYYQGGVVKLIENKVTSEIAVEEMLHPFISAIKEDNNTLYNGLLQEAKKMFPLLNQEIIDTYTESRGFMQTDRDLELVTQSLALHFKKEYQENPTDSWKSKITDLLKWFLDLVENVSQYIIGNKLRLTVDVLKSTLNLTEIAKLLNTQDIQILLNTRVNEQVRYSLDPESKRVVDYVKGKSNDVQKAIIDNFFNTVTNLDFEVNQLTTDNVILERDTHTYVNLSDSSITYKSSTTAIKGELTDTEGVYELNRLLGNDFDTILESITMNISYEEMPKLDVLTEGVAKRAYEALQNYTFGMEADGSVLIPQIVVSDRENRIAGMIDLLRVHPDGSLTIIDLKSSKNSSDSFGYTDVVYPVSEGSVWFDPQDPGKKVFTTSQQHGIQTNLYRRMLENMGYTVNPESQTFHVLVGIEGKGKNQKFTGDFKLDGTKFHPAKDNNRYVNQIVPYRVNESSEKALESALESAGIFAPADIINDQPQEQAPQSDAPTNASYSSQFDLVKKFKQNVITRKAAFEKLKSSTLFNMSQTEYIDELQQTISAINVSMLRGTVDVVFTELLRDGIKKINDVTEYLGTKENFKSPEYIKHVLYWKKFVETYRGLVDISNADGLNKTQLKYKEKLQTGLNALVGEKQNDAGEKLPGILDSALENYVVAWSLDKTNRDDMTEDDIRAMAKHTEDIGMLEHLTGDLDTSKDMLSALMAKEFKATKQKYLDKVEEISDDIRMSANNLMMETLGNTVDYTFMQVMDENGIWTGRYIKKIGYQYYSKLDQLMKGLKDIDGTPLRYIEKTNISDYTADNIEHNIKLAKAKTEYSKFMNPEKLTKQGVLDGEFHRLTPEFKAARLKVMEYRNSIQQWVRKNGISDLEVENFKGKHYDQIEYYKKSKDAYGDFTGLVKLDTMDVIKKDHVEKREISASGEEMRDSKYLSIMDPQNTLESAQKQYYLMWRRVFEDELLPKLPVNIGSMMVGKSPVVKDRFQKELDSKSNFVQGFWAKTQTGFQNFFNTTTKQEIVAFDEFGNFVEDTLPIYYVGSPRTEAELVDVQDKIVAKVKLRATAKTAEELKEIDSTLTELRLTRSRLQDQPTRSQMSKDMTDNLLKFAGMAQNYESLGAVEDTFKAIMTTMAERKYDPKDYGVFSRIGKGANAKLEKVGIRGTGSSRGDAKILQRARKYMAMTFYDNEKRSLEWYDKLAQKIVSFSSLGYVGFNVFGNINNFVMGRVNNGIEVAGALYFDRSAYGLATLEFNKRMSTDMFNKWAHNYNGAFGKGKYKKYIPISKFEGAVDWFRMLDDKTDIRETVKTPGVEGRAMRIIESVGYSLNDAFEYNVQTKTGLAILYSLEVDNGKIEGEGGRETMSLYDAMQWDNTAGKMTLKEGFTHVTLRSGKRKVFNNDVRYEIRNYIREVNKQIHGNYAKEDRMVIQAHTIGQLAAQFHKWIAPAIKARFRTEYFDENLGFVEGRYLSMLNFLAYSTHNLTQIGKLQNKYKSFNGKKGLVRLKNVHRTLGELAIFLTVVSLNSLLKDWDEDDDDSKKDVTRKRLENALMYQMNRLQKELVLYVPVLGGNEQMQMVDGPISSTRLVGEFSGAFLELLGWIPHLPAYISKEGSELEKWKRESGLYYTRGTRKGKVKLNKEWGDVIPGWYTINRWLAFDNIKNFYIK
jgi:hypothetical protein|tara:strand:- start:556 stop:6168 length:5613 start_codon:yes stop_codon:yes gene_type:complete